jgi:BlaI family penicillinase repressor
VEGRHYLYHPQVSRTDCVRAKSRSFRQRVFGGESSPMLLNMIREADLTADEVQELRRILDEKKPR